MVAAMAVEVFVQLYVLAFVLSAIIAIWLLISAARRVGTRKPDDVDQLIEERRDEI